MLAREQNPGALRRVCEEARETAQASAALERSARELAGQLEALARAHALGSPDELPLPPQLAAHLQPPPQPRRGARALSIARLLPSALTGDRADQAGERWWQTKTVRRMCGAAAIASGAALLFGGGSLVLVKLKFIL